MWLMTKYGFFSVVCAWQDETDKTPHPDLMMIRTRNRSHLENLQKGFNILEDCSVSETQGTDYPYRLLVSRADMTAMLTSLLAEIDYCNFKNQVHNELPDDDAYHDFLMTVWSEGVNMQSK